MFLPFTNGGAMAHGSDNIVTEWTPYITMTSFLATEVDFVSKLLHFRLLNDCSFVIIL